MHDYYVIITLTAIHTLLLMRVFEALFVYAASLNKAGVSIPASAAMTFSPLRCLSTAWPEIA